MNAHPADTPTQSSSELAALVHALPHLRGDARLMATDAILTNLRENSPRVATLVLGIITAFDPALGEDLMTEIGPYEGSAKWDEVQSLTDCLILTIKTEELRAVLAAYGIDPASFTTVDRDLRVWFFDHGGRRYCVGKVGTDGNTESAIVFGRLYTALRPKAAVLVGMAGGVKGKVAPGDVVVGEHIYAYDFRKLSTEGPIRRTKTYKVDDALLRESEDMDLIDPSWFAGVSHDVRGQLQKSADEGKTVTIPDETWRPRVVRGDVLAGGSLVEDGSLPTFALEHSDKVRAAEMEGAGFAAAGDETGIPWLVVRGIADIGENGRDKTWQFGSTFVAARYVRDAIANGVLKITR